MKLLIISDAPILFKNKENVAYAPYVKEMNIWMKYATSTTYVCPTRYHRSLLTKAFDRQDFEIKSVRRLEFHSLFSAIFSFLSIPYQFIVLCFAFAKADHIHLRCPGNLALLASMVQILFPSKRKTVKYAGNFDPQALQPMAYRWQKKLLSNTFLSKNIKVLVYGDWPGQTKNIQAFFTATYRRNQIQPVANRNWNGPYKAVFVGTMGANKRPLEVFELIKELRANGIAISLDYYGDGPLKAVIENRVKAAGLEDHISLHGNVENSIVTQAYKKAHFSFLLSKSEGWPKAVAEAMFWGCIPVASKVSCVHWMLGIATSNFQLPTSNADKQTYPLGLGKALDASSSDSRERLQNKETYPLGLGKGFDVSSSDSRERLQNEETNPSELGKGMDSTQRGILINDISQAGTLAEEYLKHPEFLQQVSQAAAAWSQQYTLDDFEREIALLLKETHPSKAPKK
ncbi:glycosyl transferase family 1 [Nonlabens sp. MB-3u-79]|uniref:glycosyltransferase n=1 Tax=Nonlabens sp. MB-3u-79 TaxID=2058134 RepID=UPI000C3080D1|nr:glycosyltransferase [Nonlabens sp. MB-3u-79]AUC77976.1 glycosyl transferase family 1 [Nonlabens sp. MB-3u-79]